MRGAGRADAGVFAVASGDRGQSGARATARVNPRLLQRDVEGQLLVVTRLRLVDEGILVILGARSAAAVGARHWDGEGR